MIDFPLVYCNGDSYSDENYHSTLKGKTYAHIVGEHLNAFVINNAISGSCNRRIIRSSLHDLIQQRILNPTQKIIAFIGLSFEIRGEVWNDNLTTNAPGESNFQTHKFTDIDKWRPRLLKSLPINKFMPGTYEDKYSQGRAYYYSPYAERINLMCDLVMFQSVMKQSNIEFLIFQSPLAEKLEPEYLLDFFKAQLDSDCFLDFETFSFVRWCAEKEFSPLDYRDRLDIAHYGPEAHRAFAEEVLIPHYECRY